MRELTQNMAFKEAVINENFNTINTAVYLGEKGGAAGLYYYYYGGKFQKKSGARAVLNEGSILCNSNAINYIEFDAENENVIISSSFTKGFYPIAIVTTNNDIITNIDTSDRLYQFVRFEENDGGATGIPAFGDLSYTLNGWDFNIKIKGGEYYNNNDNIRFDNASIVSDFDYTFTLSANSIYFVIFDYYNNSFSISNSAISYSQSKVLYILKTNSTTIEKITDYRAMDLKGKPDVFIFFNAINNYSTTYTISDITEYYFKQRAGNIMPYSPKPFMFSVDLTLICASSEKGYNVGDEADYIYTDNNGISGKPYKITGNNINIFLKHDQTKVFNESTGNYENITYNNWAIVTKVRPFFR